MSSPMSSTGAELVSASRRHHVSARSTHRTATVSSVTPPETSSSGRRPPAHGSVTSAHALLRPRRASCCRAGSRRRRRRRASSTWSRPLAFDVDRAPGPTVLGERDAFGDADADEVVVLEHDPVGRGCRGGCARRPRAPPPSRAPAARASSCACPTPGCRRRPRSTMCAHVRRDARQVTEEVERRALAGEDRRQRAGHRADDRARARRGRPPRPTTATASASSTCAKASVAHAVPASTPSARSDERRAWRAPRRRPAPPTDRRAA